MAQNEKELLLKDLCARLPYGVKVNNEIQGDFEVYGICENFVFGRNKVCHVDFDLEKIKPYLFPLSSMTEEQLFEASKILGKDVVIFSDYLLTINNCRKSFSYKELDTLFNWFHKNHFDYRGLIPMELAIDATELNIY